LINARSKFILVNPPLGIVFITRYSKKGEKLLKGPAEQNYRSTDEDKNRNSIKAPLPEESVLDCAVNESYNFLFLVLLSNFIKNYGTHLVLNP